MINKINKVKTKNKVAAGASAKKRSPDKPPANAVEGGKVVQSTTLKLEDTYKSELTQVKGGPNQLMQHLMHPSTLGKSILILGNKQKGKVSLWSHGALQVKTGLTSTLMYVELMKTRGFANEYADVSDELENICAVVKHSGITVALKQPYMRAATGDEQQKAVKHME